MKEADKAVQRLTKKRATIEAALAEKASSASHTELADLGQQLAALDRELATAEESWLALAEEAEAGSAER